MIFQTLEPLQPRQPQWPQWPQQPHFIKFFTDPDSWIIRDTKRGWWSKNADCKPSIVLWGRNFKPYKNFLPYFIFINLLAQEVRICSEVCFNSKWIFFHYEFSTFFDLFAKNNCDVRGRTLSFFCLFFKFFCFFSEF